MSEQSIWCTRCQRYWRPAQIAKRHKRAHAPDGGPSGYCKECRRADRRRAYWRIKEDPVRYAECLAQAAANSRRRYAALSPEERAAWNRRCHEYQDIERKRARDRRYKHEHKERYNVTRVRRYRARMADPEHKAKMLQQWRTYRAQRKARRFAARLASARGG